MSSRRNTQRSTIRWMKASPACGLLALLIGNITAAAQAPASLTLNEALARAVEANRAVLAARSARAIDPAASQAAGQRPNPEVSVEAERETPHWAFGGAVPLEVSGKRQRRIDVANATLAVTERKPRASPPTSAATFAARITRPSAAVRRVDIAQELERMPARARATPRKSASRPAPRRGSRRSRRSSCCRKSRTNGRRAGGNRGGARRAERAAGVPLRGCADACRCSRGGPLPSAQDATAQAIAGNAELQVLEKRSKRSERVWHSRRRCADPIRASPATLTYDAQPEFTYGWRAGVAIALPILTTGRADIAVAEAP